MCVLVPQLSDSYLTRRLILLPFTDWVQVMMPIHTRMIFRHFISFFWTSYVSFSRGALDDDAKDDAAMEEQERALGLSVTPR